MLISRETRQMHLRKTPEEEEAVLDPSKKRRRESRAVLDPRRDGVSLAWQSTDDFDLHVRAVPVGADDDKPTAANPVMYAVVSGIGATVREEPSLLDSESRTLDSEKLARGTTVQIVNIVRVNHNNVLRERAELAAPRKGWVSLASATGGQVLERVSTAQQHIHWGNKSQHDGLVALDYDANSDEASAVNDPRENATIHKAAHKFEVFAHRYTTRSKTTAQLPYSVAFRVNGAEFTLDGLRRCLARCLVAARRKLGERQP
jgi:hypothetical protein